MVLSELKEWLKRGGKADYITLSGSGEPTLHSRLGVVLDFIRSKSTIPAVLLTNGTMLYLPEVRNTAVRPPAEDFATALSKERMESLIYLFHLTAEIIAEFSAKHADNIQANQKTIFLCCSDDHVQQIRLQAYSVCISTRCLNFSAALYVPISSARNAKIPP